MKDATRGRKEIDRRGFLKTTAAVGAAAAVGSALVGAALVLEDSAALLAPLIWHAAANMRKTSVSATRANARNPR